MNSNAASTPFRSRPAVRGTVAGLAGGAAWFIGVLWGWVYVWLTKPGQTGAADGAGDGAGGGGAWAEVSWWKRGLRFGVVSWALMVPWFLFYLPWNVLLEPTLLVALESVCWAGVMLTVGMTIAGVDHLLGGPVLH